MPMPSIPASVRMRTRISLARGTTKWLTQWGRPSSGARRMWTSRPVIFMALASDALDRERDALAHADAHRAQRIAPAGARELVGGGGDEARPGGAQRVAERDRAAVGIHVRRIVGEAEVAHHGQGLCGERLVQLDHVH